MTGFVLGDDGFDWAPAIDPNDELDYTIDVTDVIGANDLANVTWDVSPVGSMVAFNNSFAAKTATVWLRTPTLGQEYLVTGHFTDNSVPPRKFDKSFKILCKQR